MANLLVLGLPLVWWINKHESLFLIYSTIQRPDGQSNYREENWKEVRAKYFHWFLPLLPTINWFLAAEGSSNEQPGGRRQERKAMSEMTCPGLWGEQAERQLCDSELVIGNGISARRLIFLVMMFLMFPGNCLPAQPGFFFPEKQIPCWCVKLLCQISVW